MTIKKSRAVQSSDNHGGYQIVDESNIIVAGERFELNLDQVDDYLKQ